MAGLGGWIGNDPWSPSTGSGGGGLFGGGGSGMGSSVSPLTGGIIAGLGALAGGMGTPSSSNTIANSTQGNVGQTAGTSNSSFTQQLQSLLSSLSHTQGSGTSTSTTTPNLSPQTQALINGLTMKYQSLTNPSMSGYAAGQTYGINRSADLQQQAAQQSMASRGLSTSPAAATTGAGIEANRFGNITQMQAGLPMLQNQLNLQNLGAASNFMQAIPHGTTTTGVTANTQDTSGLQTGLQNTTGTTTGATTGTSSGVSTNASNSSSQGSVGGGLGGAAGGLASILAQLYGGQYSDERLKEDVKLLPRDKAVERIMALRPVEWKWKGSNFKDKGLLAQDVAAVRPDLVEKDGEYLKVNYTGIIGDLINAVQALNLGTV
jgi:hypothetical protein